MALHPCTSCLLSQSHQCVLTITLTLAPGPQEIAEDKGIPSFWVDSAARIDVATNTILHKLAHGELKETTSWLPAGPIRIGITSGASTPDRAVEEVLDKVGCLLVCLFVYVCLGGRREGALGCLPAWWRRCWTGCLGCCCWWDLISRWMDGCITPGSQSKAQVACIHAMYECSEWRDKAQPWCRLAAGLVGALCMSLWCTVLGLGVPLQKHVLGPHWAQPH